MAAMAADVNEAVAVRRMSLNAAQPGTVFSTAEIMGRIDIGLLPQCVRKNYDGHEAVHVLSVSLGLNGGISVDTPDWAAGAVSHIEDDLLAIYGAEELARIKRECATFYAAQSDKDRADRANWVRPSDVGLSSRYRTLNDMLLAAVASRRMPELLGMGFDTSIFKVDTECHAGALEQVMGSASKLAELLRWTSERQICMDILDVHQIRPDAVELATCMAMYDHTSVARVWKGLSFSTRDDIKLEVESDYSFFKSRLPSC